MDAPPENAEVVRIRLWMLWPAVIEYFGGNLLAAKTMIEGAPTTRTEYGEMYLVTIAVY